MSENNGKELVAEGPKELIRQATDVAGVCKEIVTKTAMTIQGRKHVKVEGWQAIATAHGCALGVREVRRIEGGVIAIGECRRSDGAVIATAEGYVGDDERNWQVRKDKSGREVPVAEYARRAMAQTRAMSRVGRAVFAHVVVMMDAGLSTTPAEEMDQDERDVTPQKTKHPDLVRLGQNLVKAKGNRETIEKEAVAWQHYTEKEGNIPQQVLDVAQEMIKAALNGGEVAA